MGRSYSIKKHEGKERQGRVGSNFHRYRTKTSDRPSRTRKQETALRVVGEWIRTRVVHEPGYMGLEQRRTHSVNRTELHFGSDFGDASRRVNTPIDSLFGQRFFLNY